MLSYFTVILFCQLAGELLVATSGLPIPGPVIGMALLFAGLLCLGSVPEDLAIASGALLENLSLLFVPAGVGMMLHLSVLSREFASISLALLVSTCLTIAVTGLVMKVLSKRMEDPPQ